MTDEKKNTTLVITDRPIRWNKAKYDVITLLDMVTESKNRGNTDDERLLEEEKKIQQEENEEKIKNLQQALKEKENKLNILRQEIIQKKRNKTAVDIDQTNKKELEKTIEDIKNTINEIRKNKSEIEIEIGRLEKELDEIRSKNQKSQNENENEKVKIKNQIKELIEKKKKDEDKKKAEEDANQNKYKSVLKNKTNSIVIIDDSIQNTDIEAFQKGSNLDFFDEIYSNYINKDAYSMIVKPISIYLDKSDWFKKGVFRFLKNKVFDIYSNKEDFELNVFFKNIRHVTEFRREIKNELPGDNFEQQYQLYKEKKFNELNQIDTEIVIEKIHSVKEYDEFIKNRNKFATFMQKNIYDQTFNTYIEESNNHIYSKQIFEKIKEKYNYTSPTSKGDFPYIKDNPLTIFYVIVLHNQLTKDPEYEKRKIEIANNISIFTSHMKGIIIQSVTFTKIPQYDAVEVLKIHNTDKYYIWMKEETDDKIKKKFNGKKMYETHIKTLKFVMNNLKVNTLIKGGIGIKTRKMKKIPLNKTMSKKI